MDKSQKEKIIKMIIEAEKLRPLSRFGRLTRKPFKTFFYYIIAALSHVKPFKMSFNTLWGTKMISYLPEGNTFYYYGYCEANLANFFIRYIKGKDIILDVGAHVGFYSMLSSALVGEKGKIYSFEPTPWTFEILSKNASQLKNVTLNNVAVSNSEGVVSFNDHGPGYGAYNTAHKDGSTLKKSFNKISVKTIVLDDYCKKENIEPTLIKLDAEGYEYSILEGMTNLLEVVRPLVTLEVAGGDTWTNNCKKSIQLLISKKYKPYEISVNGKLTPHVIKDNYTYDNLVFVPEEKTIKYEV